MEHEKSGLSAFQVFVLLALVAIGAYLASSQRAPAPAKLAAFSLADEEGVWLSGTLLLTDKDGNVIFNGTVSGNRSLDLPGHSGPYTFLFRCPSGYSGSESGTKSAEGLKSVSLTCVRERPAANATASVTVKVTDENGGGVSGAGIELWSGGRLLGTYATVDGSASVAGLPLQNYTARVLCPGGYSGNLSIPLYADALQNFTCRFAGLSNFSLSSTGGSVQQGSSVTATLVAPQDAALSCSGLPLYSSCSFSSAGNYTVVTISASAATPPGNYSITISSAYGGVTKIAPYSLYVAPKVDFDFSISLSPTAGSVVRGSSIAVEVMAALARGAPQAISLSCFGLPQGASCAFSPASVVPPYLSTLTVATSPATPTGTYAITVSGGQARNATYTLAITASASADTTPPAAVADLSASNASQNSITLAWAAPGDDGNSGTALQYDIRYSASPITSSSWALATPVAGAPAPAAAGIQQSFTITGLSPSTTYYFAMRSSDEVPNWSGISNVAAGTTAASADTTPPAAITNLGATGSSATSITLSWTAPGDDGSNGTASQYDLRYSISSITSANWASAAQAVGEPSPSAAGTSQSFTVTGLSPSTIYHFAIRAADEVPNWSGLSNEAISNTLASADTVPPAGITDLAITGASPNSITLRWTAPGDDGNNGTASQYDIRYSTLPISEAGFSSFARVEDWPSPAGAGTLQSVTVAGLYPSMAYYFAIKSSDEVPNWSGMSNVANGTTGPMDYGPTPYVIKVLDLGYIPTVSGKVDISQTGDWQGESISALIANIDGLRDSLTDTLEKGSIYRGYKNPAAEPSLRYEIIEKKIFYAPVPPSPAFKGMDNAPSADHMKILNELDICDYVENKGVKEVWIWMYHTQVVAPIESNMAGPYGDISNSYRENDLPVCNKTYTVYDYNYGRSVAMAVEDHTHQIEAILRDVDPILFWNLFVGTDSGGGRCGWTHYPPNGQWDYDWNNENTVLSDCEDWNPQGTGQKKYISCRTWSTNPSACDQDEGLSFKKWWMQNLPGKNNSLTYDGKKLRNWWVFMGKFDLAMGRKSLVE